MAPDRDRRLVRHTLIRRTVHGASPSRAFGLALCLFWASVPVAWLSIRGGPGSYTGVDDPRYVDQWQYMDWIRQSGERILLGNRFDLGGDPAVFLHPMWALSGMAWRLGAPLSLAYLAWKPFAVVVLCLGVAVYVNRLTPDRVHSVFAAGLALFFVSPALPLLRVISPRSSLDGGATIMAEEMFPAGHLNGYMPTAITIGLTAMALVGIDELVERGAVNTQTSRRAIALTSLVCLVTGWLHPWQGLTLIAIMGGLVIWGRCNRRYLVLVGPAVAVLAPLAYYQWLARISPAWHRAAAPNALPHLALWIPLAIAPLAAPAAFGFRGTTVVVRERILRLWPLAAIVVFFVLESSYIYHAFAGISVPLAVLAVRGFARLQLPRIAIATAIAVLCIPGMITLAVQYHDLARERMGLNISSDEAAMLSHLDALPRAGGVLAPFPMASYVPALTGRAVWVGHPTWSPDFPARAQTVGALFSGRLPPEAIADVVHRSQATFVVAYCGQPEVDEVLARLASEQAGFGCLTLYIV